MQNLEAVSDNNLINLAQRRFQASCDVADQFFEDDAERISRACLAMAQRFHGGGRLLVFGAGNAATDAQHVSVEFVHPVIVGKRALPAIAINNDIGTMYSITQSQDQANVFSHALQVIGRSEDIALGITSRAQDASIKVGLDYARKQGMLTIGLFGKEPNVAKLNEFCEYAFAVLTLDEMVVQEIHEMLYHILWELVHVFFEQTELLS